MTELPTHDANAERAILGAALRSIAAADLAAGIVTARDFYVPHHEQIWEIIRRLRGHHKPCNYQIVSSELAATNIPRTLPYELEAECASTEADSIRHFAAIIRSYATRRRLVLTCRRLVQRAENPETDPLTLAAAAATEMAGVRDAGDTTDIAIRSLGEIMATEDDPYDWAIPGLLERGDRLILTGGEGGGKSTMLRQIGICAAAGIHPFTHEPIDPCRVVLIDAENSERQFRRHSRGILAQTKLMGTDPTEGMYAEFPGRIDITTDRVLSSIHKTIDAVQPDVMIIGPLYKLTPRAIQTDDEATPLLVALDSIRDRRVALIMEAHAGHAQSSAGQRNYRPRGSSAMLGWPEFGYGLEMDPEAPDGERRIIMRSWRGDRDERDWPTYLKSGGMFPWTPQRTSDSVPAWQPLRSVQ